MAGELSSSEDEEHNAALRSVAIDSNAVLKSAKATALTSGRNGRSSKSSQKRVSKGDEEDDGDGSAVLKLYQIRVQDLLHKHLDKVFEESPLEVANEPKSGTASNDHVTEDEAYDGATRLFSNAPRGVSLKRPSSAKDGRRTGRILPARFDSSDEDSTERNSRIQAAAIDGRTIKIQSENAQARSLARFLEAEAAAHRAVKLEEEKVAQLRRERGEEWLPSVAAEMRKDIRVESQKRKAMSSKGNIGVVAKYRI